MEYFPNATVPSRFFMSENQENFESNFEAFTSLEDQIARWIHVIGLISLTIFGTVGNILTFFVMRRGSLKDVSTCFYMSILALNDTGVLWSGAFIEWFGYLTKQSVNLDVLTDCKLGYFIFFFTAHHSSALLVIMSIEKFIALYFPLKTKSICTVRTAKWATLASAIFFFAFDFQFFFIIQINKDSEGYSVCEFKDPDYESTFYKIDPILYTFAPFAIMITANSAIIFKFVMAKLRSRNDGTLSTNQALSKSATKGTAMLITVSCTFIVLTGPVTFAFSVKPNHREIVYAVITFLQYLNHSINGVLYCIVGTRFRKELLNTLRCRGGTAKIWKGRNQRRTESKENSTVTETTDTTVANHI